MSADLPTLCDVRPNCCGVPACRNAGTWTNDPYNKSVFIQNHWHSEPACAYLYCTTYLSRAAMATYRKKVTS